MRPLRIVVEGFSAYRERVEVGFEEVDFFSLAGPTGSGKSSLVDAMIFALYGRVPRLGGNAVAPAITAGSDLARVSFDFEVEGTTYTAVRMAQRTSSGGASVREARLQEGERVIASGADDVTSAVEELLRLRFDDFTRTVVLPQGEFARFLTATKSERQGLLRNLLGLDIYTRMRELSRTRAAVAAERADGARRALEALDLATEDEREQRKERHRQLTELAGVVAEQEKKLDQMNRAVEEVTAEATAVADSLERLGAIEAPGHLDEMEARANEARSAVVDAEAEMEACNERLAAAKSRFEGLPSPDKLDAWRSAHSRLLEIEADLSVIDLEALEKEMSETAKSLTDAKVELKTARDRLDDAKTEHAAHSLAATLHVGDTCPVCAREIAEPLESGDLAVLEDLDAAVTTAEATVESLRRQAEQASNAHAAAEARQQGLLAQKEEIVESLNEVPDVESLDTISAQIEEAEKALAETSGASEAAMEILEKRRKELEEIADSSRRVAKSLTEAQISVASLEPPVPESDDVVVQWKELLAWRDETLAELAQRHRELLAAAEESRKELVGARADLEGLIEGHGVTPSAPYAAALATAIEAARAQVENDEKTAEKASEMAVELQNSTAEAAVAETLVGHLKSNRFEQWLMSGALAELVDGANELLGQLSNGTYSLHSDEAGTFSIIDHRNADEMRAVATLSGGETFLVSLALALSLAETLAARGGSGLDAIILDEGFGTLDDESLDVVATVLEELTGRGLMVGVITHVKELAARAPVRYEVTRGPAGSTVKVAS